MTQLNDYRSHNLTGCNVYFWRYSSNFIGKSNFWLTKSRASIFIVANEFLPSFGHVKQSFVHFFLADANVLFAQVKKSESYQVAEDSIDAIALKVQKWMNQME